MFTLGLLIAVVGFASAMPADPYGPPPPSYNQPKHKEEPKPYNFEYGVNDEYAGTNFGQNEQSDGNTVQGSYTVDLPDGRKQTVTYTADHYGGYNAQVEYYGEAQYPHEYGPPVTFKPQAYHPEPAYKPQPSYQPAPSYQPQYQ